MHPVVAVADGVVTLTDGTRWAMTGGTPLGGGAKLGTRIAHTLNSDAAFVERARLIARVRELAGYVLTGRRAYHIPPHTLRDLEGVLTRAVADVVRHNYRDTHSDRTDRAVRGTLDGLERDMKRAEALELEARAATDVA
jgi:hypothetical protein